MHNEKRRLNNMADASVLVLNDVLCFVKNKFCSTQAKQLRGALVDFY